MTTKNIITVALIITLLAIIWKQNITIAVQTSIINDYQHTSIVTVTHQLNNDSINTINYIND